MDFFPPPPDTGIELPTVQQLKELYDLQPHPEGGFYAETYESEATVIARHGHRSALTVIYFLLANEDVSRMHRLQADETWHFHLGGALTIVELDLESPGHARTTQLGPDVLHGQQLQHVIKVNEEKKACGCAIQWTGFDSACRIHATHECAL